MEIKTTTKFRPLIGFGDMYRVYPSGIIYRKEYDIELPNGKIRHYPKKKLTHQLIAKTNKWAVMLTDLEGKRSKVPVGAVVLYAWGNAFQKDLFDYPELLFRDQDWSNHSLDNLGIHINWDEDDPIWEYDPMRFYYYEWVDGTKLHNYSHFVDTDTARTMFNLEHRIHRNKEDSLSYRMCQKVDEVGMPRVVIQDTNPHNPISSADFNKVCNFLNQNEGWPFHPLPEGPYTRKKIVL